MEPRALCMLNKCCTTELPPLALGLFETGSRYVVPDDLSLLSAGITGMCQHTCVCASFFKHMLSV
jgi:hypothetical protein